MPKKAKPYIYVLSLDFEGGDGADLFPIRERTWKKDMEHIRAHVPDFLFSSYPPPMVEILGLTKTQWREACRVGRERDA